LTDQEIITTIRNTRPESDRAWRHLYKTHYTKVAGFVTQNHGTPDHARDLFQEVLVIFQRQICQDKFRGESSIGTYLFSIGRNLWYKELQKSERFTRLEGHPDQQDQDPDALEIIIDKEQDQVYHKYFQRLGELCREILFLFYSERLPMKEIATRIGFKNEQNARNKKLKCMNNLRAIVYQTGNKIT
jgi:RNA polymerase sigma factor (sigma-70 family)